MSLEHPSSGDGRLSRRGFLRAVGAGAAAALVPGCAASELTPAPEPKVPDIEEGRNHEAIEEAYRLWSDMREQIKHLLGPAQDAQGREYSFPSARRLREQGGESYTIPLRYTTEDGRHEPLEIRTMVHCRDVIPGNREESAIWIRIDCGVGLDVAGGAWLASEWRITEQNPLNRIVDGEADVSFIVDLISSIQPALQRAGRWDEKQMVVMRTGDAFGLRVAPDDEAMAFGDVFEEPDMALVKDARAVAADAAGDIKRRVGV